MRIAFYAPLKAPDHPVPSGDRAMARLLMRALEHGGHAVVLASRLRSFRSLPAKDDALEEEAQREVSRLSAEWAAQGAPDLWFAYHPYYKAPDLLGPRLAARFNIPLVTAEASHSPRRDRQGWASAQKSVLDAVEAAALNLCFTQRDRSGLLAAAPDARFALIAPFTDAAPFETLTPAPEPGRIVAVAMMRPGDKLESYRMLGAALARIPYLPWTLTVVGDGPARSAVAQALSHLPAERLAMTGALPFEAIPPLLARCALYAWPGCGEAYGLAYLEAQAAGLPVVAQNTAGVPEVVVDGRTGLLTPPGDVEAYAAALARLLRDGEERQRLGLAARRFALDERSLETASERLCALIAKAVAR